MLLMRVYFKCCFNKWDTSILYISCGYIYFRILYELLHVAIKWYIILCSIVVFICHVYYMLTHIRQVNFKKKVVC